MILRRFLYGVIVAAIALLSVTFRADAQLVTNTVNYDIAGESFTGYVARNEGFGDEQPIVLLIHDWDGLNSYEEKRAEMLATQGYTVMAIDLYGSDVRPQTVDESRAASSKLYGDRNLMRERLFASLEVAKGLEGINPEKIATIGYCFGGAAVLEFARSGADLDGFVSFHGSLGLPEGQDYSQTLGKLLVLHGSADPVSGIDEFAALATDLTEASVDFDMELYGGVLHSFTKWSSDDYDPDADLQSWDELLEFLPSIF
ncbi:dienelactone hydrolase [[Limnothrix rosea] IAM M-220]|nr:dienelactone hydrolase [[Limnothrix rosea] IAM M-220]